ncbi:unnamed protein product [Rotaria sp. Silwood1]|nr:unnamed protein product [Rotaria sp. Silwood1]
MAGFDARNKESFDPKYICHICSFILRDPIQLTGCGHRQCQTCLKVQQETMIKCLQCQTETSRNKILIDRGFKNDMKSLSISCSVCEWTGILNNYQEHFDQFHSNLQYEYGDEQFNLINQFNEYKVSECQKLTVACLLKDFGCHEQIIPVKMGDHYLTKQHQYVLIKVIRQILSYSNERKIEIDVPRTKNAGDYKTKLSIEESNTFLKAIKHNQDIFNQDLASLQDKIDVLQPISYDGTLVWKITNVQRKITDAQSEQQTSIYSPIFYSSSQGYKMRLRLYLNGNGDARHTYMSLFFVLMRGEYDAILKFPFNFKVTFCLYNQTHEERHIIDSFRPDIRSCSFQRPRSDMNIASGIPKFVQLKMIQQEGNPYVQDDIMFIRVMVDPFNMPKQLLSYAISLNPGFPIYVQEMMIKEETKRRLEQQSRQWTETKNKNKT